MLILCNTCFASSGGSLAESALIGLLTFPLLLIVLFISISVFNYFTNKNNGANKLIDSEDKNSQDYNDINSISTLESLYNNGILTESEYNQKLNDYNQQIQENEKARKNANQIKLFENKLEEKTRPLIMLIEKAKAQGFISEEEFEKKKDEIISRCSEEINYILSYKPKISNLILSDSLVNKEKLEKLLENIYADDLIVQTPSGLFQIVSQKKWHEILNSDKAKYYKVITEYKVPKK